MKHRVKFAPEVGCRARALRATCQHQPLAAFFSAFSVVGTLRPLVLLGRAGAVASRVSAGARGWIRSGRFRRPRPPTLRKSSVEPVPPSLRRTRSPTRNASMRPAGRRRHHPRGAGRGADDPGVRSQRSHRADPARRHARQPGTPPGRMRHPPPTRPHPPPNHWRHPRRTHRGP